MILTPPEPDSETELGVAIHYLRWVGYFILLGVILVIIAQQMEWARVRTICHREQIPYMEPFDRSAVCACAVPEARKHYSFLEFIRFRYHGGTEPSKARTETRDAMFLCIRRLNAESSPS